MKPLEVPRLVVLITVLVATRSCRARRNPHDKEEGHLNPNDTAHEADLDEHEGVTQEHGFKGGPPTDICDPVRRRASLLRAACDVDEFFDSAWAVASVVECQLMKVHTLLDLTAAEFQRLDNASARHEKQAVSLDAVDPIQPLISFSELETCPCKGCQFQKHKTLKTGRGVLLLPQPESNGTAYAYSGDHVRRLDPSETLTTDIHKINKGLRFATLLEEGDEFFENELFVSTLGNQDMYRARYRGDDPAIIMELTKAYAGGSEAMCTGRPSRNYIDPSNFEEFFQCHRQHLPDCKDRSLHARPFWSPAHMDRRRDILRSVASKTVFDADWTPRGTISFDVSMSEIGKMLGKMSITAQSYALIVDEGGGIIASSQKARDRIFKEDLTEESMVGGHGTHNCSPGMKCWWDAPRVPSLRLAKEDTANYSGADFTRVLSRLFDRSLHKSCAEEMFEEKVAFSKYPETPFDIIAFCSFSMVPSWGLIVGTPGKDIMDAHAVKIGKYKEKAEIEVSNEQEAREKMKALELNRTIVLTSRVQRQIPFLIVQDIGFAKVLPERGTIAPNGNATLTVHYCTDNCSKEYLTHGHHRGAFHISPDVTKRKGTCFRAPLTGEVHLKVIKRLTAFEKFMAAAGGVVVLGFVLLLVRFIHSVVRRHFKMEAAHAAKIESALGSIRSLTHPMVVMPVAALKKLGRLISHEDAQESHQIIWLYSVEEVLKFGETNHIVFISHQWTGFDTPDPTGLQYQAILDAIDAMCQLREWEEASVYVWVDFFSIPQRHRGLQTLAINALTAYSAHVAGFVIVAPPVQHKELGHMCDKDSYQQRAWCRAEQLAHLLVMGPGNMYLAVGSALLPLDEDEQWLRQSAHVFQGNLTCCQRNHVGMEMCDKEYLVTPMLGLWAQVCQRGGKQAVDNPTFAKLHAHLEENLDKVFPKTFLYATPSGMKEKPLFGTLLERLMERLEEEGSRDEGSVPKDLS